MHPQYVVLVGDVGVGKSLIVEKLTGVGGISSSSQHAYTRIAQTYVVPEGKLKISDTPECNSLNERSDRNMWVAQPSNIRKYRKF